jgi:hypothetical protein
MESVPASERLPRFVHIHPLKADRALFNWKDPSTL